MRKMDKNRRVYLPAWRGLLVTLALLPLLTFTEGVAAEPPGYLLITGWYKDAGPQRAYNSVVGAVLREHGYIDHFLGLEGINLQVIEGDWIPGRIMLIRFPSESHAERFWWSDHYQEIKEIREPASALDIAQVDGVVGVTPRIEEDSAYLVYLGEIDDEKSLSEQYAHGAADLMRAHGGQVIVRAGRAEAELLEGEIPNATFVIVEFPSVSAMRAFWGSEENERLDRIRKETGRWSVAEVLPRPR